MINRKIEKEGREIKKERKEEKGSSHSITELLI
jgi:hypothetical protein